MINLQTGGPACNLTGDITVLQNLETEKTEVWNRRNPPAADPFESFLSPGLTRSEHTEAFVRTRGPVCITASHLLSEGSGWVGLSKSQVISTLTPHPQAPPTPQYQRDVPSWDTGRFSRLYNAPFYPDTPFEMLRGRNSKEASRLRSKASLTHICVGGRAFFRLAGWLGFFFLGGGAWTWEQADA